MDRNEKVGKNPKSTIKICRSAAAPKIGTFFGSSEHRNARFFRFLQKWRVVPQLNRFYGEKYRIPDALPPFRLRGGGNSYVLFVRFDMAPNVSAIGFQAIAPESSVFHLVLK